MPIQIHKADQLKPLPDQSKLGFGTIFTDHMFNMDYNPDEGWHNPRIEPYAPISMEPSTMVLHYGQAVFEGLKAYRTADSRIQLFRPRDNFKRLNRSCRMLCIPEFDESIALDALKQLISLKINGCPRPRRPPCTSDPPLLPWIRFSACGHPLPTGFLSFYRRWGPIIPKDSTR